MAMPRRTIDKAHSALFSLFSTISEHIFLFLSAGPHSEQNDTMAYTCLIVLDPEIPFTLPEMKGISGTDGANYEVIK